MPTHMIDECITNRWFSKICQCFACIYVSYLVSDYILMRSGDFCRRASP